MDAGITLVTLNVEGSKHVERICDFLRVEKPDVVCLQEVFKVDLPRFAACLGSQTQIHFVPTLIIDRPNDFNFEPLGEYGVAILSSLPLKNQNSAHYFGQATQVPLVNDQNPNTPNRCLIWTDVITPRGPLRIATTHFTWSPDGDACKEQRDSLERLLEIYHNQIKVGLLCGDFNAPKGGEIYRGLVVHFKDNLPENLTTTLDGTYHRVPGLEFVVDYLFTTPGYAIDAVKLHSGLSDHQALSARLRLL